MNPTVLTMTQAERDHAQVLKQVCAKTLTVADASKLFRVSERHLYRMLPTAATDPVFQECDELCRIIAVSRRPAERNSRSKQN